MTIEFKQMFISTPGQIHKTLFSRNSRHQTELVTTFKISHKLFRSLPLDKQDITESSLNGGGNDHDEQLLVSENDLCDRSH